MSWQQYVQAAQGLGFNKVTIIARANYQTVGMTAQTDIATAWKDGDTDVNENQEILDDWTDPKKRTFCFYQKKFNIILREGDKDGVNKIVCAAGNDICLAAQFKTIWFIAYGVKKSMSMKKPDPKADKTEEKKAEGFAGAQQAYTKICGTVWDALEEAGV
eukprot:CAMPEP_0197024244 /NCGR_PEP_ID=MMETSP1384-20130603/4843_1 /TAXON_ID=29189 /ORGANISM="Ammonia sp." /LENGTH=159 /DNA_ID=CAMNT_0042452599 /DNA_START=71 /DNA_END=550 /DNA_ORIENTATION=+